MSTALPPHARTTRASFTSRRTDLVLVAASLAVLVGVATTAVAEGSTQYVPPANAPAGAPSEAFLATTAAADHEVWLVDQSNTADGHGGVIEVYDGPALRSGADVAPEVVDLAGQTTALCLQETGARPTRPHMLQFSPDQTHAVLAFVVSGHTVFFDAATREAVACFRSEAGAGDARQAHASIVDPDGEYVLVANQNGKRLERIRTDYDAGTFTAEPAATLDLANGVTPNGVLRQTPGEAGVRPDNAPICPFVPSTGFPAFVSLRGGGAFAVDPTSTPMGIVAEYVATEVARDGCGFTEAGDHVYGNGGLPAPAVGQAEGWAVFRFPLGGTETYNAGNPTSTPAVEVVQDDARTGRDAHGMTTVRNDVWTFDRLGQALQVFDGDTAAPLAEVDLRGSRNPAANGYGDTPSPDIAATSPDRRAVYVATRGPSPLSGAHAARGDAPGLLVLETGDGEQPPVVRRHVTATRGSSADPHGLAVRQTGVRTAQTTAGARGTDGACPPGRVPALRFPDVPADDVHAGSIACLDWWSVSRGFADGTYRPALPVTRGQLATFVANAVQAGGGRLDAAAPNAFADDDGSVHAGAIDRLVAAGVLRGRADGTFGADEVVTRSQTASFVARAFTAVTGDELPAGGPSFSDARGGDVERAAGAGLVAGTSGGAFGPAQSTSRAQMATVVARLLDLLVEDGAALPPAGG